MKISYKQTRGGARSGQAVSGPDLSTLTSQIRDVWQRWLTTYPQRNAKVAERRPS